MCVLTGDSTQEDHAGRPRRCAGDALVARSHICFRIVIVYYILSPRKSMIADRTSECMCRRDFACPELNCGAHRCLGYELTQ